MAAKLALLGFALLGFVRAEYNCPSGFQFPPFKINDTIRPGESCNILLSVADGTYSVWSVSATNLSFGDSLAINSGTSKLTSNSVGSTFTLKTALQSTAILIEITSRDSTTMHLDLSVEARPLNVTASLTPGGNALVGEQAAVVDFANLAEGMTYVYNATSQVVLALLVYPDESEKNKMTSYFVYEATETVPSFKGSLYQFLSKPYVSQSNSVMIFVGMSQASPIRLLINDNHNVKDYDSVIYSYGYGINLSYGSREGLTLSGLNANGTIAIIMGMHPDYYEYCYLTTISGFSDSSSRVDVYAGTTPSDDTLLTSYNTNNYESSLPQQLPGLFKTIVLTKMNAALYFEINIKKTKWQTPEFERTGFLMNPNYPFKINGGPPGIVINDTTNDVTFLEDSNSTLYYFSSTDALGDGNTLLFYTGLNNPLKSSDSFGVIRNTFYFGLDLYSLSSIGALVRFKISDPALISTSTPTTSTTSSSTTSITTYSTTTNATSLTTSSITTTTVQTPVTATSNSVSTVTSTTSLPTTESPPNLDNCTVTFFDLTTKNFSYHFSLKENTTCVYTYLIPDNSTADIHVTLRGFNETTESVTITGNYGDSLSLKANGNYSSIWPAKNLTVQIKTAVGSQNELHLEIDSEPILLGADSTTNPLTNASQALVFTQNDFVAGKTYLFTSTSKVRIYAAFPVGHPVNATVPAKAAVAAETMPDPDTDSELQAASSILVYDAGTFVGSLYTVLLKSNPFISTGSTVSLYNADDHYEGAKNPAKFTILDNSLVQNYSNYYTGLAGASAVLYGMDARNSPAAVTLMDDGSGKTFQIFSVYFEGNTTQHLDVYSGGVGTGLQSRKILTYTGKNGTDVDKYLVPQDLPVPTKTFVLDSGTAMFGINTPGTDLIWTISPILDRQGYLMTPNYMNPSASLANNAYHVIFKGDGVTSVTFDIKLLSADPTCSLSYSLENKDSTWVNNNPATLADHVYVGKSLELFISSGNATSKGALFSFSVYDPSVKSSTLFSASFLLILTAFL